MELPAHAVLARWFGALVPWLDQPEHRGHPSAKLTTSGVVTDRSTFLLHPAHGPGATGPEALLRRASVPAAAADTIRRTWTENPGASVLVGWECSPGTAVAKVYLQQSGGLQGVQDQDLDAGPVVHLAVKWALGEQTVRLARYRARAVEAGPPLWTRPELTAAAPPMAVALLEAMDGPWQGALTGRDQALLEVAESASSRRSLDLFVRDAGWQVGDVVEALEDREVAPPGLARALGGRTDHRLVRLGFGTDHRGGGFVTLFHRAPGPAPG